MTRNKHYPPTPIFLTKFFFLHFKDSFHELLFEWVPKFKACSKLLHPIAHKRFASFISVDVEWDHK